MNADPLQGGGYILQPEASVTATENTLMAAVLAPGETIIDNAASEPHVRDLCRFLVQMGAQIDGIGTNRLIVQRWSASTAQNSPLVQILWKSAVLLVWQQ